VHACSWMKVVVEQAGDVCCREGGMVYRTRVWVPGPQLVLQTDQVLLPARMQKRGATTLTCSVLGQGWGG
jgi:hypothetical protein